MKSNNKENGRYIRREILNRSLVLYYIFVIIALIIIIRMLWIQYSPMGEELRAEAEGNINFSVRTIDAKRGDILSHDGRILASTVPQFFLYMDFKADGLTPEKFTKNVDSMAMKMSGFFKDKDARVYSDSLKAWYKAGLRYKRITPRRINYIELKELSKAPILREPRNKSGIIIDTSYKRVLPYGSLARRTIGSVNEAGLLLGLEGGFNETLKGVDGRTKTQKISGNFWMPVKDDMNLSPIDGNDVVSTIDIDVQDVAESKLKQQLLNHEAIWGTAILMEVETGAIRAIANLKRDGDNVIEDYNYAIGMNMEPGSTFKIVSLMALLDDAKANMNETYETGNGVAIIGAGRSKVVDSHAGGFGTLTLRDVFVKSSNVGFAKAINRYYGAQPSKFLDYIYNVGIAKPFDLQIKGESAPVIRRPGDKMWNGTSLTMMSFGYAVMMTPVHTLSIYNAIANDGVYVQPLFASEIRRGDETIEKIEPKVINPKICSDKTVREIRQAMEEVVNDGTARVLLNENYRVAGKTGTAQIAKGKQGYLVNGGRFYLATMVGYFPADKPKYSCIVAIETFVPGGSGRTYYGGSLSGPVFRAIADKVYSKATNWANEVQKPTKTPTIKAKTVENSVTVPVRKYPFVIGGQMNRLTTVFEKLRVNGMSMPSNRNGLVIVDSSGARLSEIKISEGNTMPNVVGLPLREALHILDNKELKTTVRGSGVVKHQSVEPGRVCNRRDTVTITLSI